MVEISDITDRGGLEAWLEDQPREVAVWIASRAAARALPLWWRMVLTEGRARQLGLTALPVLRCLLISSVAAVRPTEDIKAAAYAAADAAARASAARGVARAVAADTAYAAAAAYAAADAAADADAADLWNAVRTDAAQVQDDAFPDAHRLWPEGEEPFGPEWQGIKTLTPDRDPGGDWQFWIEWYQSLLDGRPMLPDAGRTWEMLEQIALIDPKTWDQGPEVVNPRIREIWELYHLRAEAAALRAEKDALLTSRATTEQRSHNAPPGLVEDAPAIADQITIIWAALDDAGAELDAEQPDKSRLKGIARRMLAALQAVAAYCGKLADTVVMSAAKVGGATGAMAALDSVANNGRLVQFAKDLLAYALGG